MAPVRDTHGRSDPPPSQPESTKRRAVRGSHRQGHRWLCFEVERHASDEVQSIALPYFKARIAQIEGMTVSKEIIRIFGGEFTHEGAGAFFTVDAGPQLKVLCKTEDRRRVEAALRETAGVLDVIAMGPGPGAWLD